MSKNQLETQDEVIRLRVASEEAMTEIFMLQNAVDGALKVLDEIKLLSAGTREKAFRAQMDRIHALADIGFRVVDAWSDLSERPSGLKLQDRQIKAFACQTCGAPVNGFMLTCPKCCNETLR